MIDGDRFLLEVLTSSSIAVFDVLVSLFKLKVPSPSYCLGPLPSLHRAHANSTVHNQSRYTFPLSSTRSIQCDQSFYLKSLVSLTFFIAQSILEVFLVCAAGYALARHGILDKKTQKVRYYLVLTL